MNHLFWVYGNLIHYNINPRLLFFGLYILLNKRKTPCLIDHWQWYFRYDILEN